MSECWDEDPLLRPSFSSILERLFAMTKTIPDAIVYDLQEAAEAHLESREVEEE